MKNYTVELFKLHKGAGHWRGVNSHALNHFPGTTSYVVRTIQRFDLFNTRVWTSVKVRFRRTVQHWVPMPTCHRCDSFLNESIPNTFVASMTSMCNNYCKDHIHKKWSELIEKSESLPNTSLLVYAIFSYSTCLSRTESKPFDLRQTLKHIFRQVGQISLYVTKKSIKRHTRVF